LLLSASAYSTAPSDIDRQSLYFAEAGAQQQTRQPPLLLSIDNTIQYNTKFVKRHVAVASEALGQIHGRTDGRPTAT